MDELLKLLEESYSEAITQAELNVSSALFARDTLIHALGNEKQKIIDYFSAVAQKKQAERIIANTDPSVIASASVASEELIK